jgi:hypothetical protein
MHIRHIDRTLLSLRDDWEKLPRLSSILAWHPVQPTVCLCVVASRPVGLIIVLFRRKGASDIQYTQAACGLCLFRMFAMCYALHLLMVRQSAWCCICLICILISASTGLVDLGSF